jgi:hypothetical protein
MANDPALQDRAGMPQYLCPRGMIRTKMQKGVYSINYQGVLVYYEEKKDKEKTKRERWCWQSSHPSSRLTDCTYWFVAFGRLTSGF